MARENFSRLSKQPKLGYVREMRCFAYFRNALLAALTLCSSSSFADKNPVVTKTQTQATQSPKECECRAKGQLFSIGEKTCLNGMIAICEMNQNVTNWRSTRNSCPSANLSKPMNFSRKI
jgi:hypothetical protein